MTGGSSDQPLSSEIITVCVPTLCCQGGGPDVQSASSRPRADRRRHGVPDPAQGQTLTTRKPGDPGDSFAGWRQGTVTDRTPNRHVNGESDDPVVPAKQAKKAGPTPADESVEGRRSAKRNVARQVADRTQSRKSASSGLSGVRKAARRETCIPINAFASFTQRKSRMRSFLPYGSVRGGGPKGHPYRDNLLIAPLWS